MKTLFYVETVVLGHTVVLMNESPEAIAIEDAGGYPDFRTLEETDVPEEFRCKEDGKVYRTNDPARLKDSEGEHVYLHDNGQIEFV